MKGNELPVRSAGLTVVSRRARVAGLIVLFLILPLLAFPELIFGHQTLYKTDLTWMHFPRHTFAASEWLAGRVPLWDPYEDTGIPLLAESQVGVLYPLSAIFLSPLAPSMELSLFILIHFSLAAFFTFMLARLLELSWGAAAIAGLAYGFGGFLTAQVPNLNIMTGAVWLPLIFYGLLQTVRRRSWLAALLAGIPLTLQILTAQPQIVFYSLVSVIGYTLYRVGADLFFSNDYRRHDWRYTGQTLLLLAMAVCSGLLLAAPQLIPTYELQQLSVRSQERGLEFLTSNSLPPLMWLNLILPSAFGNNVTGFKGGDPFQEDFIYFGFLPLLLAGFGVVALWRHRVAPHYRDRLFFLLLFCAAAVLAMGRFTPLYELLVRYLPGFALFRIPARWLMAVNLALAIIAGIGLDAVLQKGLSRRAAIIILLVGLAGMIGLILVWTFKADLVAWASQLNGSDSKMITALLDKGFTLDPVYRSRWLSQLRRPVALLMVNLAVAVSLLGLVATRRLTTGIFTGLVILAVSFDLTLAGDTTINPTKPANWWWQLSDGAQYVLDHLETGRVFPLGMGSEELTTSQLGQYFPSIYRVHSAGGHGSSLRLQRYTTFLKEAHPVQAIRIVGVRYLLAEGYLGADAAATYPIVYADEHSLVYENKEPLPRAFIVHQIRPVDAPEAALAYLRGLDLDPRQTAIIETDQPELLPQPDSTSTASTVTITYDTPQTVEIQTSQTTDGYLVMLDTYYPGWVATIDGQNTPIYRANYIGRAVFVPAGEHLVKFEYKPWSFKLGLWLAVLLAGLIIALAAVR